MKFHRVEVENLNSLYGVQTVDFERDVRGAALFLIVGPTGSGKSTILDAICLALFGQTPRLDRRVGRADTDVAHIMSIGTAKARAQVEFSTLQADGTRHRYLAEWSARRAFDDPEGAWQRPERSLYRKFPDGTMKLVVSDHREKYYQPGFDAALRGLSVHDFKRSILLAQGEFSAFLHASDQEKASILERLTNTDNYRKIGQRAARRRREVDEQHRALMLRLEEQQILTLPQERELAEALAAQSKLADSARTAADVAAVKMQWLQSLETLEAALNRAVETAEQADAALTARTDDAVRLARDAELLEVEPAWREVERAERAITTATAAIEPHVTRRAELEAAQQTAAAAVERAQAKLTAETSALDAAQPTLRLAFELRTRREERAKRMQAAQEAEATKARTHKEHVDAQTAATTALTAAKAAVDTAAERVNQLAPTAALADRLPALKASFEDGIQPLRARVLALQQQVEELLTSREQYAQQRADRETVLAEGRKERGKWQATLTRAENKLKSAIGDDRDASSVVNEINATLKAATQRAEALREANYLLQRVDEHHAELAELDDRLRAARTEVDTLEAEQTQVRELEAAQRTALRSSEDALRQNERVIALSAYRNDLQTGTPCPLCGSPVHPYCESAEFAELDAVAAADRERLEIAMGDARDSVARTAERLQRLAAKFVARKTALAKDDARAFAVRQALEGDQRSFANAAERAGYAPLEAFRLKNVDLLQADLDEATKTASESSQALDAIEKARQAVTAATEKIAGAQAQFAEVEQEARELDERIAQLDDRIATRRADLAAGSDELDGASNQLLDDLRDHGIDTRNATVEAALQRASEAQQEVRAAAAKLEAAQRELTMRTQSVERAHDRCAAAKKELNEAQAQSAAEAEALAAIDREIAALFDGRDPTAVRASLEAAVAGARKSLTDAQSARAAVAQELAANAARHDELTRQIAAATEAHQAANAKLDHTLERLGLERSDVAENLLAPQLRRELTAEFDALAAARTRAHDRVADAQKRLDQHTASPKAEHHETLIDATEALRTAREHADATTRELGALQQRWAVHEQTKDRRATLEDELQAVQRDLDIWNTIHGLIGARDGDSFKLFAQSLNLQGLVDNANTRLQRLHARYELTVARGDAGEPTLSFKVRDRYQANAERPLTTLSGGETFLVSLALALGLADFRRIDMPIETLLLDEGFGALDQDSLHMALTTLHQLHRDASRQIGIISHVDALRELIDARIILEPRGHGRSTIRFEFGAHAAGPPLELLNR